MSQTLAFASDYMEGAHPKVLEALVKTNLVSTTGYGQDELCKQAAGKILEACRCPGGEVYFMVGGTQANATVLTALLERYQGVLTASTGHICTHEAGAIELGGHKVLPLAPCNGKITAEQVQAAMDVWQEDENHDHVVMPGAVYISQPTEYGTLYSKAELTALRQTTQKNGMRLFVDGARLAYALAAPENDVTLADLASLTDVFSIGGTKCGLLFGEAVVFPQKGLIPRFFSIMKQRGAVLAKGRLLGVQFDALFTDDLYLHIGAPAIRAARRIREKLLACGYPMPIDSPTNQIFFTLANEKIPLLAKKASYGYMEKADEGRSILRFATAWSTDEEKTEQLLAVIEELR